MKLPKHAPTRAQITSTLGGLPLGPTISVAQAAHIANAPREALGDAICGIYTWLASVDAKAWVPMDNWDYVMAEGLSQEVLDAGYDG